jgi:hypothetical protein
MEAAEAKLDELIEAARAGRISVGRVKTELIAALTGKEK